MPLGLQILQGSIKAESQISQPKTMIKSSLLGPLGNKRNYPRGFLKKHIYKTN